MVDSDEEQSPDNHAQLSQSTRLSQQGPAAIGAVLGLLAHDLRNPLAALASNVGFLAMMGEDLSDDMQEAIFDLQLSVEALGRIVDSVELVCNDLSDAKIPVPVRLRVADLLRSVLPPVERAAQSHGVQFELDPGALGASGTEQSQIIVSEVVFVRALSALLHNAITAAPSRSLVRLSLRREAEQFVFCVQDQGSALDPQLAHLALSAAGQPDVKTARGGRYSRGLGLYVVQRCAEMSGARFEAHAQQASAGSTMELRCTLG